jgi:hypothetical protein
MTKARDEKNFLLIIPLLLKENGFVRGRKSWGLLDTEFKRAVKVLQKLFTATEKRSTNGYKFSRRSGMKILFATLLLVSTSLFAQELDATEALLWTLPQGNYWGLSTKGNPCSVSVRNLSNKIAVSAAEGALITTSEVFMGAPYRWSPGKRDFLASVFTTTLSVRKENFVRMIAVEEKSQYVAVGDIISSNTGTISENVIECVVHF